MLQLFIFLALAFIVYYAVEPEKQSHIWLSAIFIPLCGIIVYTFVVILMSSAYYAGGAMIKCLLPAFISGIVIFFLLEKKKKTNDDIFNKE